MVSYKKKSNSSNIYQFKHTPCFTVDKKFKLQSGKSLLNPSVAYKTYGKLNKEKSENNKAITICDRIIKKYPKSLGAKNCTILKKQINAKSLSITVEKNIPTNTNTRMLINYKNIDHLYFTAYKITNDQLYEFNRLYKSKEKVTFINSLNKLNNWKAFSLGDESRSRPIINIRVIIIHVR